MGKRNNANSTLQPTRLLWKQNHRRLFGRRPPYGCLLPNQATRLRPQRQLYPNTGKLNIKYPVFAMIGKITGSFCAWMMRYNSVIWIWMGLLNSQKNYTSYLPSPNPSIIIDEMDIFTQSIHYD